MIAELGDASWTLVHSRGCATKDMRLLRHLAVWAADDCRVFLQRQSTSVQEKDICILRQLAVCAPDHC